MSSKKLSTPDDLNAYASNRAFIRIFKYKPLNQYDHLICIDGDRGQGTTGEVAYLIISEAAYNAIAELHPIAQREAGLNRSELFEVGSIIDLVKALTPAPATEG
ncbi:hypothetical protein [Hymenobacter sp. 102]|uniref:hypothetical protein n=1 Tax=Hymenobacter sp. 102 TaxID=3403152 RepID=UPI003CF6CDF6